MSDAADDDLDLVQVLPWVEFCAWSALVMTPILWWLQGSSVSNDQFIVRTGMVVLSAIAAVGLRLWAIFAKRGVVDSSVVENCQGNSDAAEPSRGNTQSPSKFCRVAALLKKGDRHLPAT